MLKETTVGEYLIQSLKKVGIDHVFGIPGDYVVKFFNKMENSDIKTIGTCSEQGAAFAADAYSRVHGIGALCVTYCVGGLNTVNAVAGAYAEKAPLIVISGAPGICERNGDYLLHHSIRDIDSQLNVFKEVTIAQCQLDDPQNAPYEIDRVISACIKYKRPVYIELPRDMVDAKCDIPPQRHEIHCAKNTTDIMNEALKEALDMIKASKKPIILGGVEIRRYKIQKEFTDLLETTGYPYLTTILGKSIIDESHPQFLGVYMGKIGYPEISNYLDESDCTIMLGALMTDTNMGTAQLDISKTIYATADQFCIKHHYFKDIDLKEFIVRLTEALKSEKKTFDAPISKKAQEFVVKPNEQITITRLFDRLNSYTDEDNYVICDVGDSLFGSATLNIPKNSAYLGPAYYTSMGYAIPATLGVLIKNPELRPLVIVGDGAFQMTGHELSCFAMYNLKPIVLILNNKGYTTQRYLKDGKYNDIHNWNYHLLPEIYGTGLGLEASTEGELEEVLAAAKNNTESFTIINVHLDKFDKSATLDRLTSIFGKKII